MEVPRDPVKKDEAGFRPEGITAGSPMIGFYKKTCF